MRSAQKPSGSCGEICRIWESLYNSRKVEYAGVLETQQREEAVWHKGGGRQMWKMKSKRWMRKQGHLGPLAFLLSKRKRLMVCLIHVEQSSFCCAGGKGGRRETPWPPGQETSLLGLSGSGLVDFHFRRLEEIMEAWICTWTCYLENEDADGSLRILCVRLSKWLVRNGRK